MKSKTNNAELKILIVSQYFWPENFRINDFATSLAERGHHITVLTGKPNYPGGKFFEGYSFWGKRSEVYKNVNIIRVPLFPRGRGHGLPLALNYLSFVIFGILLGAPRVLFQKFDFIFVHQLSPVTIALPGIFIKWIKKIPLYMWVQDLWPESLSATGAVKSSKILDAVSRLVNFIYRQCDVIFVQSKGFFDPITSRGIDSKKIVYMPNWAENIFSSDSNNDQNSVPPLQGDFKIIFAGNIGEAQDFPTILKAAEILKSDPKIKWYVLGNGRKKDWVQSEIARLGLENCVQLLGQYPLESMPLFFKQADALLVSLKRDPIFALTIPGKIQSYLASGKPIIASLDGEGSRVISESQSGIACEAENPQKLAACVQTLLNKSSAERAEMGARGQKYFLQNYTQDLVITDFIKNANALLNSNKPNG